MASYTLDQNFDMLVDDIFDGWLSVPAMGDLFDRRPQPVPEYPRHSSKSTEQNLAVVEPKGLESEHQSKSLPHSVTTPDGFDDRPSRKRRGHTKSRLGCLTCKRRKIKVNITTSSFIYLLFNL